MSDLASTGGGSWRRFGAGPLAIVVAPLIVACVRAQSAPSRAWATAPALALLPADRAALVANDDSGSRGPTPRFKLDEHDGHVRSLFAYPSDGTWLGGADGSDARWWSARATALPSRDTVVATAVTTASALWPDFRLDCTQVSSVSEVGTSEPNRVRVQLASTPLRRVQLRATIDVFPWSGKVVFCQRNKPVLPPTARWVIGEDEALRIARQAVEARKPLGAAEPSVGGRFDGRLVWEIVFYKYSTGRRDVPAAAHSVSIDGQTGQVISVALDEDLTPWAGMFRSGITGRGAATEGPVPWVPSDHTSCWTSFGLALRTERARLGCPWWQSARGVLAVRTKDGWRWHEVHMDDDHGFSGGGALGRHHLLEMRGKSMVVTDLATGRASQFAGTHAFAVQADGEEAWLLRSDGGAEARRIERVALSPGAARAEPVWRLTGGVVQLAASPQPGHCAWLQADGWIGVLDARGQPARPRTLGRVQRARGVVWLSPGDELLLPHGQDGTALTLVKVADGAMRQVDLPLAIRKLKPYDWAAGPRGVVYFTGGAGNARRVYEWKLTEPLAAPVSVAEDGPIPPFVFGNQTTSLDLACEAIRDNWVRWCGSQL